MDNLLESLEDRIKDLEKDMRRMDTLTQLLAKVYLGDKEFELELPVNEE
jgi:hypothetical protein